MLRDVMVCQLRPYFKGGRARVQVEEIYINHESDAPHPALRHPLRAVFFVTEANNRAAVGPQMHGAGLWKRIYLSQHPYKATVQANDASGELRRTHV
jgi:hypothetical protein